MSELPVEFRCGEQAYKDGKAKEWITNCSDLEGVPLQRWTDGWVSAKRAEERDKMETNRGTLHGFGELPLREYTLGYNGPDGAVWLIPNDEKCYSVKARKNGPSDRWVYTQNGKIVDTSLYLGWVYDLEAYQKIAEFREETDGLRPMREPPKGQKGVDVVFELDPEKEVTRLCCYDTGKRAWCYAEGANLHGEVSERNIAHAKGWRLTKPETEKITLAPDSAGFRVTHPPDQDPEPLLTVQEFSTSGVVNWIRSTIKDEWPRENTVKSFCGHFGIKYIDDTIKPPLALPAPWHECVEGSLPHDLGLTHMDCGLLILHEDGTEETLSCWKIAIPMKGCYWTPVRHPDVAAIKAYIKQKGGE